MRKLIRRLLLSCICFITVTASFAATKNFSKVDAAQKIMVNGVERQYWLYVPEGCPENAPMVVAMHGTTGKMTDKQPRFNEVADQEKFVVIYPQGLLRHFPVFGGETTGWASTGEYSEDVDFIRTLVKEVGAKYDVDKKRIYCCGFSNGGMNTYSLTNFCSDIFAAFGSISGFPINEFHLHHVSPRPVPFIHIHGKQDNFVKYALVPTIIDNMVARNGANPVPVRTSVACKYDKNVYQATEGGFPVIFYEVDGMGHNDFTTNTEDGSSSLTMWKFFKQYTLDSPCDTTLKWRPNIESEGYDPTQHGWKVNDASEAYSFGGDSKTDANQNVYHSLQFVNGKYKLTFHIEGVNGTKATVRLVRLMGDMDTVLEQSITKDGDVVLPFTIADGWGEYRLTFVRNNKTDQLKVTRIAIHSLLTTAPAPMVEGEKNNFENPVLWADVPDPDVIRVGDNFYMVSTTMHLMPGAPIMRSKDLVNWETVNYIFPKLTDSPKYDMKGGTVYGRGQWATSLKYHGGKFYALFAPNDNSGGETYICMADSAEGEWTIHSRMRHFHDASLFFDDDDKAYVVYGTGEMVQLNGDLTDVVEGSHRQLFERDAEETGLLEGSRMIKHDGKYYLLMISWTKGHPRREVCYRADNINGPYEKKVVLETEFAGFGGVGQGTIVDTPDGKWYGIIFQDRGGVGRVLTLEDCTWKDGWPMLGDAHGNVPLAMQKPVLGYDDKTIVHSDDFDKGKLDLQWQWNHNPVDEAWSLSERPGSLRLKTSRLAQNLFLAPNTLTTRMEGPTCEAVVKMDVSKMKDGDVAGFAAFQGDAALVSVKKEGNKTFVVASKDNISFSDTENLMPEVKHLDVYRQLLKSKEVYMKISCDFRDHKDLASLSYSSDGKTWTPVVSDFKMIFDYRRLFMGTRFAIYNYATKSMGGYVDVDSFGYSKK